MAANINLPKGKTQLYCYIKIENKKMIARKAKEFGISESKLLDLLLDRVRAKKDDLKLTQLVIV
jgi:hypothetical protein